MREVGLAARPRTRGRVVTTDSAHGDPIAPNRLARQFDVHGVALNQLWVRDTMEVDVVTSALQMARDAWHPAHPA